MPEINFKSEPPRMYRLTRADREFEQVVYGEILVPNVPNVYGDIMDESAVRQAMYTFAEHGFIADIEHDQVDRTGDLVVVESFIARPGDPDFIEGSWVVGMKINDPDTWAKVLSGDINGFSYEATCSLLEVAIPDTGNRVVSGITEPDLMDGHTHSYTVVVNTLNQVVAGGTEVTDGHSHTISYHTTTDESNGHTHRFQVVPDDIGEVHE